MKCSIYGSGIEKTTSRKVGGSGKAVDSQGAGKRTDSVC